jgi:hypothetical protein
MSDDAHITMRIVRHALDGNGLRYNVGDTTVQPATSPLNLVTMLVVSWVVTIFGVPSGAAVIAAAAAIASLSIPAFGICAYLLMSGDRRDSFLAAAAAAFAMCVPISLATIGLETLMSMALCFGSLIAYRGRRLDVMGWLLGLAFLARHDAVILAGLLYFLLWRDSKREDVGKPINALVGFLAVVAPWVVFSLLYYGVATPTTLESKAAQGGTSYWPAWYPTMLWHWLVVYFGSAAVAGVGCALAGIGLLAALWKRTRASGVVLVFALYQLLVFASYSAMQMPDYHWYFVPYGITLVLLAGWWIASRDWVPVSDTASATIAVFLVAGIGLSMARLHPTAGPVWESYSEVGRYLEEHSPRTAVGLMEIGIIGFYAPSVRVFDFAGVATLEQAARVSQNAAHTWLDDPSVADVVVIRGVDHPLEPDFDDRFESLYEHGWTGTPSAAFPTGLQVWRLR